MPAARPPSTSTRSARVREPCLAGRVLRARLVAEAEVAGRVERVALRRGVAHHLAEVPAERLAAALHHLLGAVQVRQRVGRTDALEHRVEVALVLRAVDALEAELTRPLLAHPRIGAQT